MYFIPAAKHGSNGRFFSIHVSFSASEGISLEMPLLLCVPSASPAPPSWQKCGSGKGCYEIAIIFKMESDHTEAFSSSYVCAQDETGCTERFEVGLSPRDRCWAEEGSGYTRKGRVRGVFFFFFFFGTWVKWKPLCLFFLRGEGNHVSAARHWTLCSVWLALAAVWTLREKWKRNSKES